MAVEPPGVRCTCVHLYGPGQARQASTVHFIQALRVFKTFPRAVPRFSRHGAEEVARSGQESPRLREQGVARAGPARLLTAQVWRECGDTAAR
jgi:hypothetical protein